MNNTDKAYQELLEKILTEGKEKGDRTGTGTISIFSHTLEMDMADGFPLLTTKKMFTRGIIHELLWFLNGDTNIRYLVENGVNIWTPDAFKKYYDQSHSFKGDWPDDIESFKDRIINNDKFAEMYGELGPIYGKQWVNWEGKEEIVGRAVNGGVIVDPWANDVNQIQNAIDTLNNNPDSRRIMVSAWNVGEIDKMALPPCHFAFQLYTEELTMKERYQYCKNNNISLDMLEAGLENVYDDMRANSVPTRRLHLKWHQRSVDVGLGLPFNIASYAFLLHMFAQQVNMVPGTLVGDLTNVHIYKNHINALKEQISRDPLLLPKLELKKAENIFSYQFTDFNILDYKSHDKLPMNISV